MQRSSATRVRPRGVEDPFERAAEHVRRARLVRVEDDTAATGPQARERFAVRRCGPRRPCGGDEPHVAGGVGCDHPCQQLDVERAGLVEVVEVVDDQVDRIGAAVQLVEQRPQPVVPDGPLQTRDVTERAGGRDDRDATARTNEIQRDDLESGRAAGARRTDDERSPTRVEVNGCGVVPAAAQSRSARAVRHEVRPRDVRRDGSEPYRVETRGAGCLR